MSAYGPLLAALVALLVGLTVGKAWERYKLREAYAQSPISLGRL